MKGIRYVILGTIVMLFAGSIYGWSVYQAAMTAEFPDWAVSTFSLNFSLTITFFCIGTLAFGFLSKIIPPKIQLIFAAVCIFAGFFITSRMHSPIWAMVSGIMCGFPIGIVYNAVLTLILKWFPGRSGLISGILFMGYGFSSMLMCNVFSRLNVMFGWRTS